MKNYLPLTLVLLLGVFFTNIAKSQISDTLCGFVWEDLNSNGIYDSGEPVLSNVTITVDGQPWLTDSTGHYNALVLGANHTISFNTGNGWIETFPASPPTYTYSTNTSFTRICGFDFGEHAQLATGNVCQNFDDSTVSSTYDVAQTFYYHQKTWLSDWAVTDGTPSVFSATTLANSTGYSGPQFVGEGVGHTGDGCDGLQLLYNFQVGQTYTISFADKNWDSSYQTTTNYYLLPIPLTHAYDSTRGVTNEHCGYDPTVAGGVLAFTSTPTSQWTVRSFTFRPTANFQSLWLSVSCAAFIPSGSSAEYLLDSFCVNAVVNSNSVCQSFDDSVVSSHSDINNTFYYHRNTWLSDWQVTDGTPSVFTNTLSGVTAYDGTQYVGEGVCSNGDGCDGLEFLYNFQAGQTYQVSLADRNWNTYQATMKYYLLPTPLIHTYDSTVGCTSQYCGYDPTGAGGVLVFTSTPPNQWNVRSFTFTPATNCQALWLSVSSADSIPFGSAAEYCFDSFCVTPAIRNDLCQNFDDSIVSSPDDIQNTFYYHRNTWLSDWQVTDGTPSVFNNSSLSGVTAYDGTQYVGEGYCSTGAGCDGLELLYNFQAGQTYEVSLADRNWNGYQTTMNYYLLPSPLTHTYDSTRGCTSQYCGYDPTGAGGVLVFSSTPPNQWTVRSFTFTPAANCQALWLSVTSTATIPNGSAAEYCLDSFCLKGGTSTEVREVPALSHSAYLQNIPNPFSGSTSIYYRLPDNTHEAYIVIYDITGRMLNSIPVSKTSDSYVTFNGEGYSNGIYIYSLVADGNNISSKKMVLTR